MWFIENIKNKLFAVKDYWYKCNKVAKNKSNDLVVTCNLIWQTFWRHPVKLIKIHKFHSSITQYMNMNISLTKFPILKEQSTTQHFISNNCLEENQAILAPSSSLANAVSLTIFSISFKWLFIIAYVKIVGFHSTTWTTMLEFRICIQNLFLNQNRAVSPCRDAPTFFGIDQNIHQLQ